MCTHRYRGSGGVIVINNCVFDYLCHAPHSTQKEAVQPDWRGTHTTHTTYAAGAPSAHRGWRGCSACAPCIGIGRPSLPGRGARMTPHNPTHGQHDRLAMSRSNPVSKGGGSPRGRTPPRRAQPDARAIDDQPWLLRRLHPADAGGVTPTRARPHHAVANPLQPHPGGGAWTLQPAPAIGGTAHRLRYPA